MPDAPDGQGFDAALAASDAILDGIVGIGATPGLRDPSRAAAVRVRDRVAGRVGSLPVAIAVDLPERHPPRQWARCLDPDGVIPADLTVTFGACKTGLAT